MKNLKIEVVQEFTGRYLKIMPEEKAGEFGESVLRYNKIDGILGAQVQQVDHMPQYLYEIGDRISLSDLFRSGQLTARELKRLMNQLVQLFEKTKEYLLDERDLILMSDYIFYDERTKKLSVAYLDGYGGDVGKEISGLMEVCMDGMNHRDKELIFLVYGLHRISREKNFSLHRLTEVIGEKNPDMNSRESRQPVRPKEQKESVERREDHMKRRSEMIDTGTAVKKEWRNYGRIALYIAACLFVFLVALYTGLLTKPVSGELDLMKTAAAALALVVLAGYLIGKERGVDTSRKMADGHAVREGDDQTTILFDIGSDDTVVLDEREMRSVYINLIPEDWRREEIQVRKSPFFIGKNPEKVDGIIGEREISRVHAKLVAEEEGIFLIDQESTNGTYVNGSRLVPWERTRIGQDDQIGFASVYYKVEEK